MTISAVGAQRVARWAPSIQDWGPVLALGILSVAFGAINPRFLTLANLQGILDSSTVLLILSVGITFVILMGAIDLSVEGIVAVASVSVGLLVANQLNDFDLGFLAVPVVVAVGAAFGLFNGVVHTRLRIPSFMVTLGTGSVGLGIAAILAAGYGPIVEDRLFLQWGTARWVGFSSLTWLAAVVIFCGYCLERFTRFGRYTVAIGSAEELAGLSGVAVSRQKVLVFALAGAMYGLAGVMMTARLGSGTVLSSNNLLFPGITAVVIGGTSLSGGRGGVLHSVVGVLLLAVINNGMILIGVSPYFQRALYGILILAALVATGWALRSRMRIVK